MLTEYAAYVAVMMENNLWNYEDEGKRQFERDEEGNFIYLPNGEKKQTWNLLVLARLAGYSEKTGDYANLLTQHPVFKKMVAYHRRRFADPNWRKKNPDTTAILLQGIADELVQQVYDDLKYHHTAISFKEKVAAIKVIGDIYSKGISLNQKEQKRFGQLLHGMVPEERQQLYEERKKQLERQSKSLDSEFNSEEAAEIIEGRIEDN